MSTTNTLINMLIVVRWESKSYQYHVIYVVTRRRDNLQHVNYLSWTIFLCKNLYISKLALHLLGASKFIKMILHCIIHWQRTTSKYLQQNKHSNLSNTCSYLWHAVYTIIKSVIACNNEALMDHSWRSSQVILVHNQSLDKLFECK